jgi:hypothetical protein
MYGKNLQRISSKFKTHLWKIEDKERVQLSVTIFGYDEMSEVISYHNQENTYV